MTVTATTRLIDEMVRRIVGIFHPLQIILFGSHARGTAGPDSDVDLLVVMPEPVDKRETAVQIREALSDSLLPKDIIVSSPDEIAERGDMAGTILRPALREGKILYEQTAARR